MKYTDQQLTVCTETKTIRVYLSMEPIAIYRKLVDLWVKYTELCCLQWPFESEAGLGHGWTFTGEGSEALNLVDWTNLNGTKDEHRPLDRRVYLSRAIDKDDTYYVTATPGWVFHCDGSRTTTPQLTIIAKTEENAHHVLASLRASWRVVADPMYRNPQ